MLLLFKSGAIVEAEGRISGLSRFNGAAAVSRVSSGHLALRSGLRGQPPAQPITLKVSVKLATHATVAAKAATHATITVKPGG